MQLTTNCCCAYQVSEHFCAEQAKDCVLHQQGKWTPSRDTLREKEKDCALVSVYVDICEPLMKLQHRTVRASSYL